MRTFVLKKYYWSVATLVMLSTNVFANEEDVIVATIEKKTLSLTTMLTNVATVGIAPCVGIYMAVNSVKAWRKGDREGDGISSLMWSLGAALVVAVSPYLVSQVVAAVASPTK